MLEGEKTYKRKQESCAKHKCLINEEELFHGTINITTQELSQLSTSAVI